MKKIIFILIVAVCCFGCNQENSLEPIIDNSSQFKISEDDFGKQFKFRDSEEILVNCEYRFDPCNNCGGLINGSCLDYRYDDAVTIGKYGIETTFRYLNDVQYFAPSKIQLNGKTINTCNIYTLNRTEKISQNGKVLDGEVWGSFKVIEDTGHHPLDPTQNPMILFTGKFSGDIDGNVTKIKLAGKGHNFLVNRNLILTELQVCNSSDGTLNCISAGISGKITCKILVDE